MSRHGSSVSGWRLALVACVLTGGCRWHFDSTGDHDDGLAEGVLAFDAPLTCLNATVTSCSKTTTRVSGLAASTFNGCAIRDTGITCWGLSDQGQLGFCGTENILVPTDSFGFQVAQLAVGELHVCARLADGQLWCWGSRSEGQSGDGIGSPSPIPRRIGGIWRDVAARRFHMCGVASDGTLWCWGHNDEGNLGLGDQIDRGTPAQVGTDADWARVWVGGVHSCALKTSGAAYCWGGNADGELGDGTTAAVKPTPVPVIGGITFASLSLGNRHTCGLDVTKYMWCWGLGASGQLGNSKSGPAASESQPFKITFLSLRWNALAAGSYTTCGLDAGNGLYCWGDNSMQSLMASTTTEYSQPLLLAAGPFAELAAGGYITCIRDGFGAAVWCFGSNAEGEVGVGDMTTHSTLQQLCFPN